MTLLGANDFIAFYVKLYGTTYAKEEGLVEQADDESQGQVVSIAWNYGHVNFNCLPSGSLPYRRGAAITVDPRY